MQSRGDTCFEWFARVAVLAAKASERSLGAEHPSTFAALGHLAVTLYALGRFAEAEPLQRRCLEAPRASQRRRLLQQLVLLRNVRVLFAVPEVTSCGLGFHLIER